MSGSEPKIIEVRDGEELPASAEELGARAAQLAGGLNALGVRAGDRVCYLLDNMIPVFEITQASMLLGVYPVPINYHFKPDEIRYVLENSNATCFVTSAALAETAAAAAAGIDAIQGRTLVARGTHPGFAGYDELVEGSEPWTAPPAPAPGVVIYTSGTTGNPKGVMRDSSYAELRVRLLETLRDQFKLGAEPVHLVTGPLYHSAPNAFATAVLALGGRLVIMPRFDAESALAMVEKYRITHVHLVPTMMHRMLALPAAVRERYDLSSISVVHHGAAPCPPTTKRAMIDWWGPVIDEYYGSTEAGFVSYIDAQHWLAKPGSVGRPFEDVTLEVLDENSDECPRGEVGEIYIGNAFTETFDYHADAAKKDASTRAGLFTNGDMGFVDDDGYLFLSDRKSDMIISGGVNIYPAEIEAVLHAHDDVADCAVFGIPDAEWGEKVHAVVQLEAGAAADADSLREYCAERLAGYKVPRTVELADELPRQPSGKIYKRKLRDRYWQGRERNI